MVHPSKPGVCRRRKTRAPPSTRGSISKSSSHTARSRSCLGRRVRKRSVGSRMWPSADTTKRCGSVIVDSLRERGPAPLVYRSVQNRASSPDERGGTVTKRWTQRPEGSTWGDFGDDDELGRINLVTPEKVLEGVREGEHGITFCLSLPLDFPGGTALNQRRYPPRLAPTEDMDGTPEVFYNKPMSEMREGDDTFTDVWADDQVTLWLQYSTQWDSLAHVGGEFDADGDGEAEAVYYNGYRAGVDLVGPSSDARGDGAGHACFAHHLGLEHMAFHGGQGRGVLVDLAQHLGDKAQAVKLSQLQEIMAADNVVVEPGDMLLLHTGFATKVLEWNKDPDPVKIHRMCTYLDAHDPSLLEWIA